MDIPVDVIIVFILLLYAVHGLHRGVVRILIGPLALLAGIIIGYNHWQKTHDLLFACFIMVVGPIIATILGNIMLSVWNRTVSKKKDPSTASQMLGAFCGLVWGVLMVGVSLVFILLLPGRNPALAKIQNAVRLSYAHRLTGQYIRAKIPEIGEVEKTIAVTRDPEKLQYLEGEPEIQAIKTNRTFRALVDDPDTIRQIKEQDLTGLLRNEKFLAVLKDRQLMDKIFKLYGKIKSTNFPDQDKVSPLEKSDGYSN